MSILKENPSISAKELILKVHQKNSKAANMLTKASDMKDIKNDPEKHGKYLLLLLRAEHLSAEISRLKIDFYQLKDGKEKDNAFKMINDLQKQQASFKTQANEMI